MPQSKEADPANSPGFFEQGVWYSQANLDVYFRNIAPYIPSGTAPIRQLIDGAEDPEPWNSFKSGNEANLDLQVAFGLVYPTIPTVYQVDDTPYEKDNYRMDSLFNTFLDAVSNNLTRKDFTKFPSLTSNSSTDHTATTPHTESQVTAG